MKKIAITLLALAASSQAFGSSACDDAELDFSSELGTYAAKNAACTVQMTGKGDATFVVNDFVMTVSSGVSISAVQNARSMAVAAGATKGRNVFTGHSNGGSVSQCNDAPINAAGDTPASEAAGLLNIAKIDGCNNKDDISGGGSGGGTGGGSGDGSGGGN